MVERDHREGGARLDISRASAADNLPNISVPAMLFSCSKDLAAVATWPKLVAEKRTGTKELVTGSRLRA